MMDWWDELRESRLAVMLFGLMLAAGTGMLTVMYAGRAGWMESAAVDDWSLRLFTLVCAFPITYGVVRMAQVARRGGLSALLKDDDDEPKTPV